MGTFAYTRLVMERLSKSVQSGSRTDWREFSILCTSLSKLIDHAVVKNHAIPNLQDLSQLLKKVCERKDDLRFQPAIMVLMLSVKNALHLGWFSTAETQELLVITQELSGHFIGSQGLFVVETGVTEQFMSSIIPRFFPWLRLQKIIFAIEIKTGYETVVYDFNLTNKPSAAEPLRLFVLRKDCMDTSACLVTPPHVNFLMNGKGVERRCIVSMDTGPQLPTDVTGMLKVGINIMQIVGEFPSPYIIVLALSGMIVELGSPLGLQPYDTTAREILSDDDLIEGPSRISLRCPISHKRIRTPVKGAQCKHHQCFDYDSFMEINCRRPAWRCPCCNRNVNFPDLRLDKQMMKVMDKVQGNIFEVMISEDGSWEALLPKDDAGGCQLHRRNDGTSIGQESPEEGEIVPEKHLTQLVDLSGEDEMDEEIDGQSNQRSQLFVGLKRLGGSLNGLHETEDIKPDIRNIMIASISEPLASTQITTSTTFMAIPVLQNSGRVSEIFESVPNGNPLVPILTDSVVSIERMGSLEALRDHVTSSAIDILGHLSSLSPGTNDISTMHSFEATVPERAGSVVSNESLSDRQLNREFSRTPIAIQALPAQTLLANPNQRFRVASISHPNSPVQPISGAHSSATQNAFYMGGQRPSQLTMPNGILDTGYGALQDSQSHFLHANQLQILQDSQTQFQSHVQTPFVEDGHRPVQQSQSLRIQSMHSGQRIATEQQNVLSRNSHQPRSDHQGLHQQQVPHQATRHPMQNLSDGHLWQNTRLSASQLQQIQQTYLSLGSSSNLPTREDGFNSGQGGLVTGMVDGMPIVNQSPAMSVGLVGSGRRQPLHGTRSVASQSVQRSSLVPSTTASLYIGENRWVSSANANPAQLVDGTAIHTIDQSRRPVARMRGSITATGRVAASTLPLSSQGVPGSYAWLYGLSTQPTRVLPPTGNSNPSSRLSPPFTSSWIGEQGRHWGQAGGSVLHNTGIRTGQTGGLDLNWIETQLELPLSSPNLQQGTASTLHDWSPFG